MESVSDDVHSCEFFVRHFDAGRIGMAILHGNDPQSCFGSCVGDQLNDRFPRNQRLGAPVDGDVGKEPVFDLVPLTGAWGKWHTVMASPVSSARRCISRFHKRLRQAFEPPPSAVISSRFLSRYKPLPCWYHQRRILSTANCAVSWSMPTLKKPWLCTRS